MQCSACCPSRPLDTPLALMQAVPWPTAGCSDCQHYAVVIRPVTERQYLQILAWPMFTSRELEVHSSGKTRCHG
eukprot:461437-Heterocapsa_arctica.AAC.2